MSKTVQEIMAWVEEEEIIALQNLWDERGNGANNHLATAYSAEYDLLVRLRTFITE